jgi:ABC-type multidrug transport system fused ATPase/permease subunit
LVLQKGEIVESGNHEKLIQDKGVYFNLVELQGIESRLGKTS